MTIRNTTNVIDTSSIQKTSRETSFLLSSSRLQASVIMTERNKHKESRGDTQFCESMNTDRQGLEDKEKGEILGALITKENQRKDTRQCLEDPNKENQDKVLFYNKKIKRTNGSQNEETEETPHDGQNVKIRKEEKEKDLDASRKDTEGNQNCLICYDQKGDCIFMDCGHGGICLECSLEIWKKKRVCYLCRNVKKICGKFHYC